MHSVPYKTHRLKSALVDLRIFGIYGLTHGHSRLWAPAITTLIVRRYAHV
jgi:hypothetical protein